MSSANPNANKPYLATALSTVLNYSVTQPQLTSFATGVMTAGSNKLTVSGSSTSSPLSLGSYIVDASGNKIGAVITVGSNVNGTGTVDANGNGDYLLDLAPSSGLSKLISVSGFTTTPQTAFQILLNNPIPSSASTGNIQYYQFVYSLVKALNYYNDLPISESVGFTSGKNGVRVLATMDDGTPIVDTGKCVIDSSVNNQIISLIGSSVPTLGNTYVNFSKKITILNSNFSSNNTVTDVSGNSLTLGTAGGNGINENHHTRPEFLLALFSSSSTGTATRWSSSTGTTNIYLAQRMGFTPEANFGGIRVNVPVTYSS
jgi:hypothetical protein